ncbi:MAG: phage virion morphogenesis protein [Pseudomonadota bacterium]
MNDPLAAFDARVAGLLAALEPRARTGLARDIARELRASQAARIAAQKNPDGSAYVPRKPQLRHQRGGLRRRAMFAKLRTARWLKIEPTPASAVVAFANQVQRIAQVHQRGLRDRVNRNGQEIDYPARQLLGFTDAEIGAIGTRVLDHLAGAA